MIRTIEGNQFSVSPDESLPYTFTEAGTYIVTAQAYSDGESVGISQLTIVVYPDGSVVRSSLDADELRPFVTQPVGFTTVRHGFTTSDVQAVQWNFGDGQTVNNQDLSMNKAYLQSGPMIVQEIIILEDETVLSNMLNLYVRDEDQQDAQGTDLTAVPLVQEVGQLITFDLDTVNIDPTETAVLTRDFDDGTIQTFTTDIPDRYTITHGYGAAGIYRVKAYLYLHGGRIFINEATVNVIGQDPCA